MRTSVVFFALLATLAFAWTAMPVQVEQHPRVSAAATAQSYNQLKLGMDRAEVVSILGEPTEAQSFQGKTTGKGAERAKWGSPGGHAILALFNEFGKLEELSNTAP